MHNTEGLVEFELLGQYLGLLKNKIIYKIQLWNAGMKDILFSFYNDLKSIIKPLHWKSKL